MIVVGLFLELPKQWQNNGVNMYIVMIYSDSTDPWAYGSFKDLDSATEYKKKYQASWTDRDWDSLEAHIIKVENRRIK